MREGSVGPGCCRMLRSQVTVAVSNRGCQVGSWQDLHLNSEGWLSAEMIKEWVKCFGEK